MGVVLSVVVSLTSVCISNTMGRLTGWRWTWWVWCQTKASTSRWRGISNRTMTTSSGWTSRQTSTQSTCLLRRAWQPAGCTSHVQVKTDLVGGLEIYVFVCVCAYMCGCMHVHVWVYACMCVCVSVCVCRGSSQNAINIFRQRSQERKCKSVVMLQQNKI